MSVPYCSGLASAITSTSTMSPPSWGVSRLMSRTYCIASSSSCCPFSRTCSATLASLLSALSTPRSPNILPITRSKTPAIPISSTTFLSFFRRGWSSSLVAKGPRTIPISGTCSTIFPDRLWSSCCLETRAARPAEDMLTPAAPSEIPTAAEPAVTARP